MYDITCTNVKGDCIMAKKLERMSMGESEIMRLVISHGPATVAEIHAQLPEDRDITYATVQTLLRRLEKKGYLTHETKGRAHVFKSAVSWDQVVRMGTKFLVERLFGGNHFELVQYLARSGQISAQDIENLKKLVTKKDD